MEHRGSGLVVDSSVASVTRCTHKWLSTVYMYAVYTATYHPICTLLIHVYIYLHVQYTYQITQAIQIRPGLPS